MPADITIHPLTPDRWRDIVALFDTNSVTRYCNCMWFRQTGQEYSLGGGESNRRAFKRVVDRAAQPPGLIAYVDGKPAGWCALAPREDYVRLARSKAMAAVDDKPVWSVTCFFVARTARGHGLTRVLLRAAVDFAREQRAGIVEGYPVDPAPGRVDPASAHYGLSPVFAAEGFREVARHVPKRPVMRRVVRARRALR